MELTHPRWLDDPTYIFTTLKTYLQQDNYEVLTTRTNRNNQRIALAKQTLKKLPWWQRKIYQFLMNSYLKLSQLREEMRMCFIQGIWMNRVLVMEVARRLVANHILQTLDEVAFITYEDILLYVSGQESAENLFSRQKIAQNRRRHLINQQIPTPPLTFIGYWDPATHLNQKLDHHCLVGVGSSPGRVVGKARIILNLEEQMDEFEPGEILITCFTDTAWTPLFNLATAVVVEIGSLLSHSSIVARELGIPAVVNTKVATQVIRTGDTLVVDGNEGKVYLQSQSHP
jgi:pyruvate,water dikinase